MNIPRFPIHFIGAGPGAEDLITERGAALLKEADVVVYAGSLVNWGGTSSAAARRRNFMTAPE